MSDNWKNKISFVACPNHDTNVGWDKLFFISPQIVKCSLCGKEFSREEIKQLIVDEYYHDLQTIQRACAKNLAQLQYISDGFESAQQTFVMDGGDSATSDSESKPAPKRVI